MNILNIMGGVVEQTVLRQPSTFDQFLADFYRYLADPNNLIIIALIALGIILKRSETVKDQLVPLILMVVGMGFSGWIIKPIAQGILRGIIYAAISVMVYQMVLKYVLDWLESKFNIRIISTPSEFTSTGTGGTQAIQPTTPENK